MDKLNNNPPKWALKFLKFYCKDELQEEISGDLSEEFAKRLKSMGKTKAKLIFWFQVFSFFRPFAIKQLQLPNFINHLTMLKHYLKIAFRSFSRQKLAVTINILSLTLGIGTAILIFLFIQNEWNYDNFHKNKDQLYRVNRVVYDGDGVIVDGMEAHPLPISQALQETYPEVLETCRIYETTDYLRSGSYLSEERLYYVDSSFFELFTFPFLQGDPSKALDHPENVVITNQIAQRLFGTKNPIGETVEVFYDDQFFPFQVAGVIADIPSNSTLSFDIALPFHFFANQSFAKRYKESWNLSFVRMFALLQPNSDLEKLHQNSVQFCNTYFTQRRGLHDQYGQDSYYGEFFQPLEEVHFDNTIKSSLNEGGVRDHSYILGGISLIILLIGCINFTILAIGRSARRVKEIGVRKVVGAKIQQLRVQFMGEALLISFLSMILGVLFAQIFIPQFNSLSNRSISISSLFTPESLLFLIGTTLITGILAGLYPAMILSQFKPITMMKNKLKLGGGNILTKSLVTLQFILSTVLVVVTLIMTEQLKFMKNKALGFDKEMLVVVQRQGQNREKFFGTYKNELSTNPNVLSFATTNPAITHGAFRSNFEYEGKNIDYHIALIDANYIKTMGIEMAAGRDFRPGSSLDSTQHIIINQAFADDLGFNDPIGQKIKGLENAGYTDPIIIGVTKDFHFQSLEHQVSPMWMALAGESSMNDLIVKIHPSNTNEVIKKMEDIWKNLDSNYPFTYSFLDEDMAALYESEERWSRIISISGLFAVLIAFMGMYGLISLSLAGRKKEMSLRKVLGASLQRIVMTLTGPFASLVMVAIIIAIPLAWFFSTKWLSNFAYHIPFSLQNIFLAFGIIWGLFFLSIGYHIWKSSRINPVEFLKSE